MKWIFVFCCSIVFNQAIFSQTVFNGKLILKDKTIYNYKLVFENFKNTKELTGFSITDEHGKNETKTLLKGTYSAKKKTIIFEEYQIEKTKVKAKDLSFCYVNGTLNLIVKGKDTNLAGTFEGKLYPKNDVCATGIILLKQDVSKEIHKPINIPKETIVAPKEIPEQKFELKNYSKIEQTIQLTWNSDEAVIEVWDQGNEDGDLVSLYFDGQLIKSNIALSKTKQSFKLKISKNEEHTISILAENEGKYPPNTAAIIIYDGSKKHLLYNESKLDEMKSLKILRK